MERRQALRPSAAPRYFSVNFPAPSSYPPGAGVGRPRGQACPLGTPVHFTCAAEVNSALRQGFPSENACTPHSRRRGLAFCLFFALISPPAPSFYPPGAGVGRPRGQVCPLGTPVHFTCAAEVNSALRQGFPSENACTPHSRRRGLAFCLFFALISPPAPSSYPPGAGDDRPRILC